jgi:hypothetical protein
VLENQSELNELISDLDRGWKGREGRREGRSGIGQERGKRGKGKKGEFIIGMLTVAVYNKFISIIRHFTRERIPMSILNQ